MVLLFLYIYPLRFVFVPGATSTRIMMGIVGLCLLIHTNRKTMHKLSHKAAIMLFSLLLIGFVSMVSLTLNGTHDSAFVLYPISAIMIMGGAFFLRYFSDRSAISYTSWDMTKYFTFAVLIQNTLAVILFFLPTLATTLRGLLVEADSTEAMMEQTAGFRLIGFGMAFFGAGIISSIALIFTAYRIRNYSGKIWGLIGWISTYTWIAVTGVCMARTTYVGVGVSMAIFVWNSRLFKLKISGKLRKIIAATAVLIVMAITFILLLPASVKSELESMSDFAFELFINYQQDGEVSSSSTNELLEMWEVMPSYMRTWIIGDGLWVDPMSGRYYMSTDVGYLRLIFYFGIIGMLTYMWFQYNSVRYAISKNRGNMKIPLLLLFAICMILNLKGLTDIIAYSSLFFYTKIDL